MLWLALPVFAEQTLIMLVGFVDTYLTGRFVGGADSMAAIGLMSYTMWLLPNMFATLSIGTTALVARWSGAGLMRHASRAVHQATVLGAAASVFAAVALSIGDHWFVTAMQLRGTAAELAEQYLGYLVLVLPCIMVEQVLISAFRAAGDTMSGFLAMSLVNVSNAIISTVLVTGAGGMARLGWEGLAIGTCIGHIIGSVVLITFFLRGRAGLQFRGGWLRPNWDVMRRLLSIGLPGGADVAAVLSCHLIYVGVINSLGTLPAAVHSLTIRIESLAYLPGTAFQVSATTMAGQYLGARDPRRAARGVWMSCLWAMAFMIAMGAVFFVGGANLARFFAGESARAMVELTRQTLRIAAMAMPALALMMVLSGALRGAGDTRWPFLFSMVGMAGVRIPLGSWLAMDTVRIPILGWHLQGQGLGIHGAWYAMVADIAVRALLVLWRFFHGGWRAARV